MKSSIFHQFVITKVIGSMCVTFESEFSDEHCDFCVFFDVQIFEKDAMEQISVIMCVKSGTSIQNDEVILVEQRFC